MKCCGRTKTYLDRHQTLSRRLVDDASLHFKHVPDDQLVGGKDYLARAAHLSDGTVYWACASTQVSPDQDSDHGRCYITWSVTARVFNFMDNIITLTQ